MSEQSKVALGTGYCAVVTGAGSGLGAEYAKALAAYGVTVIINDRPTGTSPANAIAVAEEIRANGGKAVVALADITTVEGRKHLLDIALEDNRRIGILVNNAGFADNGMFHKRPEDSLDPELDIHLRAVMHLTHAVNILMRAQGFGRVIFITSATGAYGNPGQIPYAAGKSGLIGFMKTLAQEGAAKNVRCNAVAPIAYTPMTEGLPGFDVDLRPEFVSHAVVFLASIDSPNGMIISVCGNRYAEIYVAETDGPKLTDPSPESIRDNLSIIRNRENPLEPGSLKGAQLTYSRDKTPLSV